MDTGFKVGDVMTSRPVMVEPGTTLQKCAGIMKEQHVGGIIIGAKDKLLGILSEQDIVRKAVALGMDTKSTKVENIMETKLYTIEPDKDIYDAIVKMRDLNIRHLPVIKGGKMVGLLTMKDILKIEPSLFDILVERIELREEDRKPVSNPSSDEGTCDLCGEYTKRLFKSGDSMVCRKCRGKL